MPKCKDLTDKQKAFIKLIMKGEIQSVAYTLAGYKASTDNVARVEGSKLLNKPRIQAALQELRGKIAARTEWDGQRLINSFEKIYERSMQAEAVLDHEGNPTGEYRYDSSGANKALENIAKIIGAYSQTDGNTVIINQFLTSIQKDIGIIDTEVVD